MLVLLVAWMPACAGALDGDAPSVEPPTTDLVPLPGYLELAQEVDPASRPHVPMEPAPVADALGSRRTPSLYHCRLRVVVTEPSPPLIRSTVRRHANDVRACYNRALRRDPTVEGRVTVQFVIDPDGKVPAAAMHDTEIDDPLMVNCITRAVRRWTFPVSPDSGTSLVRYPWVFSLPPTP